MNRNSIRTLVTILLAVFLAGAVGCTEWLWATNAGSFAAGWWARELLIPTTSTCYRNGEPVDCGTLPAEFTQ